MSGKGGSGVKTDNHQTTARAKLEMREAVVSAVRQAGAGVRVFEAFGGVAGVLAQAYRAADLHEACDLKYVVQDPRRRYIGDNMIVMRAIDLGRFNVFDLDAYGSPWPQMEILEGRRSWEPGEVGAVVITDASDLKLRWGGVQKHALARYAGLDEMPPTRSITPAIFDCALAEWLRRSSLVQLRRWDVNYKRGQAGTIYAACMFRGRESG